MDFWTQLWDRIFEVQAKPELWMLFFAWSLAIVLTVTPAWRVARNVITVVHEGGHAVIAAIWGRRVGGIKLNADTSGVTITSGNPWGLGVIFTTAAGYTAPAVFGLFLSYLVSEGRSFLALIVTAILMLLIFLSIRNLWGLIVTIPIAAGLYYVLHFSEDIQTFAILAIATFLTIASTRPIIELQRARFRGEGEDSDADQLQKLTFVIPGIVWVAFFMVFSLVANALSIWLLSKDLFPSVS